YDFTSFITNLSDFLYGTSNTSKLLYYVQSSSSNNSNATSLNGVMSPLMTDTGSYTIYIYPAANFAWENEKSAFGATAPAAIQDKTGYVVTFTITAKPLTESDINWGTTTFTYNGKEQAAKPTINASSLLNTADTDVKLADVQITAGTSTGTTAGKYTATLDGFVSTSTRAFNYTIGSFTKEITINPYELDAPTMSSKTGTFNGKNQDLTVTLPTASSVTGYNANTLITGTVLGGWEAVGATAHQASYANGKFTFLNAGTYQITFALTDTQNYKWKNGTAPVLSDIKISRMEIVAPALGNNRTMEYDGTPRYPITGSCSVTINNTQYSVTISGNTASVTVDGHTITWSVHYANYEGNFDYVTDSIETTDYGTYYIQFNILDETNQSHLNYVWVENEDDDTKLDFMQNLYGEVKQSAEDGTALFLAYMITRQLFQPKLEALNSGKYIFGDNGLVGTYTQDDDLSKVANFIHLAESADTTTVLAANPTITYKIYALTSLDSNFELVEDAV
ncbi:MAG: hypothetical protein K2O23_04185, partial [Anaeroplasmataceae bacterium]|nr:hypothetical protein [Anaeroplasmataceae bacterium]